MGTGRPFATGPPFVCAPLLSLELCALPFEVFPKGDLGPAGREEPFVRCCGGERDRFEVSLSRRIVPFCWRLRLDLWRFKRVTPRVVEASSASSLSEKLCLRLAVAAGSGEEDEEVAVAVGALLVVGCSAMVAAVWVVLEGAESIGAVETGEFGMAGWAEATGGGAIGVVSSARTKVGEVYLQMTQVFVGGSAVPEYGVV